MKKLLLILLCLPLLVFGQLTYVPDDNFEQALINLGYDNMLDDSVITININSVTTLSIYGLNITDLTGIEYFSNLTYLDCKWNQLTSLDVSQNTALTSLSCCMNQLTSIDVSGATALASLWCSGNQFTTLDLSNNTALTNLECHANQLTSLDLRNGNNHNLAHLYSENNPLLYCIDVDNAAWSTANWTNNEEGLDGLITGIDPHHYFSENCP
jgi:Leucine-rich repeat (LRR) protein